MMRYYGTIKKIPTLIKGGVLMGILVGAWHAWAWKWWSLDPQKINAWILIEQPLILGVASTWIRIHKESFVSCIKKIKQGTTNTLIEKVLPFLSLVFVLIWFRLVVFDDPLGWNQSCWYPAGTEIRTSIKAVFVSIPCRIKMMITLFVSMSLFLIVSLISQKWSERATQKATEKWTQKIEKVGAYEEKIELEKCLKENKNNAIKSNVKRL